MTTPGYPAAARSDSCDDLHGHAVPDPYRWLEDPDSAATREWLAAQDELYAGALAAAPGRDRLSGRLAELLSAGLVTSPAWRGSRQFFMRRRGGQEHAVLYTAAPGEAERALIDPMALDPAGTTTLDAWQPDREGRLLAYQLSRGGREESDVYVMDIAAGRDVDGPIDRCRYTSIAWLPGGKAFYYARRLAPGQVPAGEEQYHRRVYLHYVGTPADDDILVFGGGAEGHAGHDKTAYYGVSVSADGRWLVIDSSLGTAPRNDVWVADLTASPETAPALRVLQQGTDALVSVWPGRDGRLYLHTDRDAPRGRVAVADPADPAFPGYASWQDVLPADDEAVLNDFLVLDGPLLAAPLLLAARTRHAIGEVSVHDLATGQQVGLVPLPGLGSVSGLSGRPEGGPEAWLTYTDYATPPVVLHYDAAAGTTAEWARAPGAAGVPGLRAEQVAFESRDGTTVRMVIISGPGGGGANDGGAGARTPRPAILYGYGGFNVSLTPAYSATALAWAEAGGIYAVAGLRGGSEEGEDWHRAGMREHKQNVFDDLDAAAAALIGGGWTTPGRLAVSGGSNGGLLVGAAITQQPDRYAAALCSAPLLDMVRYEQFGLGETWNDEYGTAADPAELAWLLGYSPYHHVRAGTRYPAVLFTVFDGDTRVDPMHARKLCAALQYATTGSLAERPVLLRRERDVGHGARAVSRTVALAAEQLAFAAAHTGLELNSFGR
jgi:prolyl oligopeptidase